MMQMMVDGGGKAAANRRDRQVRVLSL